MTEENKTAGVGETGDVLNTSGERKIMAVPEVHTTDAAGTVHIPAEEEDRMQLNTGAPRFIKSGSTPFVSVRETQDAQEHPTEVSKYSDRFTTKASMERMHTGYTGKINTYDAVHAAAEEGEKMIRPAAPAEEPVAAPAAAETPAAVQTPTQAPEAAAPAGEAGETKVLRIGETASEETGDDAPTKHIRTKGSLLREIADSADDGVRRNPDQMMMEGFDTSEKDEALAQERRAEAERLEQELDKTRRKMIGSFKFWNEADETGSSADEKFSGERDVTRLPAFLQKIADRFSHLDSAFAPVKSEEYTDENDRKTIFATLIDARRNTLARILITAVLGLVLFGIDLAAAISAANSGGFFSVLGGNYKVLISINLGLLAVCAGVMAPDLKNGVFSLLKVRPKADTSLVLMLGASLVQLVAAYFSHLRLEADYHLMAPAAILLCVPYLFAKLFYLDNTRQCFKSASSKSDKSYLRKVSDENLVSRLLCERGGADSNVVYAGKTRFVSDFLARSANCAHAGMPASRLVLICAGLSLICGVIAWILKGSFLFFATAFALCLAFSFPVGCLLATGFTIAKENKKLSVKSSFVLSFADARDFAAVDNIAADAAELIDAGVTNCLTAKNVSERQARFVAAAIAAGAGSVMGKTFADDVAAFEEKLPPAENVVYEDKLGLSAWVSGCKVLLGTHAILVNHSVRVPEESAVTALLNEGELPLYLAIEGHFTAVFAVKYRARADLGSGLADLISGGTNILLSTTDANITEVFAEQLLGLPDGCVRIVGSAAAAQLADARSTVTDSEEAGIVFTDSFGSLCRCAAAAVRLDKIKKISKLICTAGACVFSLVVLVLVITGAFAKVQPLAVVCLQAAWIAFCFASPLFTGLYSKLKLPAFLSKKKEPKETAAETEAEAPAEPQTQETFVQEELEFLPVDAQADEAAENPAEKIIPKVEPPEPEVKGEVSEETAQALESFMPQDEAPAQQPAEAAAPEGPVTSEKFKKTVASIGSLFSKLTVAEEEPDEAEEPDLPARRRSKEDRRPAFSLFSKDAERYNVNKSAEEIERDYEEKKQTEKEIRATFTAPDLPEAPKFDLSKKETPEPMLSGSFEPPVSDGDVDVFDDALFSRFEDDQIFAGLREEQSQKKYDF